MSDVTTNEPETSSNPNGSQSSSESSYQPTIWEGNIGYQSSGLIIERPDQSSH